MLEELMLTAKCDALNLRIKFEDLLMHRSTLAFNVAHNDIIHNMGTSELLHPDV